MLASSPSSSLPRRLLALGLAIAIAITGGVVAGRSVDGGPVAAAAPPAVAAAERVDLMPVAAAATSVIEGLTADLPVPEPSPLDAYAPTPEVRLGQLQIPSIGLDQPLFQGVTLTAIDKGPSHWPGSAMPGQLGNSVIAGHRTTNTRPFWDLDLVQPGDELIITLASGERHVYTLDRVEIVEANALNIVDQTYGYRATLFGCHPKGSVRQRIVGHFTLESTTPA